MGMLERFHHFRVEWRPPDVQVAGCPENVEDARAWRTIRRTRHVHDVCLFEPAFVASLTNERHVQLPLTAGLSGSLGRGFLGRGLLRLRLFRFGLRGFWLRD